MIDGYCFICYDSEGRVLGEFFQRDYPTRADMPSGTVRIDIAMATPA